MKELSLIISHEIDAIKVRMEDFERFSFSSNNIIFNTLLNHFNKLLPDPNSDKTREEAFRAVIVWISNRLEKECSATFEKNYVVEAKKDTDMGYIIFRVYKVEPSIREPWTI